MVSDPDLYIQDHEQPQWQTPLLRYTPRLLRIGMRGIHSNLWDRRTCHSFWALYCSPDRSLVFDLDDKRRIPVPADDVLILPPWLPFRHRARGGQGLHGFLLFALPYLGDRVARSLFPDPILLQDPQLRDRYMALQEGRAALDDASLAWWSLEIACAALRRLHGLLSEDARRVLVDPHGFHAELGPALQVIEEHLAGVISVADLAAAMGVSEGHCSRLFRQHLGESPIAYVIGRRVARAATRLIDSDSTLDSIAKHCGFPDRHYLSRQFRRRMGMPPSRYRELHR